MFSWSAFVFQISDEFYQFAVRRPALNPGQSFDIQPANEPAFAVINVNVTRLVVANKPFQNITAAPDFAPTFKFLAGRLRSGAGFVNF
jgi:hypothetical protein